MRVTLRCPKCNLTWYHTFKYLVLKEQIKEATKDLRCYVCKGKLEVDRAPR